MSTGTYRKAQACRKLMRLAAALMRYEPGSPAAWVQAIADIMAMNPRTRNNGLPLVLRAEKAFNHALNRGFFVGTRSGYLRLKGRAS